MNLLRRHLDPLAWGKAFKKLLKLLGVKGGKGGDRRSNEPGSLDTAKSVAAELGVEHRTAQKRLKLADDYDGLPKSEQAKVDAGEKMKETAKLLREEKPKYWTQARVAAELGVARETVRNWFMRNGHKAKTHTPKSNVKIPLTENSVIFDRVESGESQEHVAAPLCVVDGRVELLLGDFGELFPAVSLLASNPQVFVGGKRITMRRFLGPAILLPRGACRSALHRGMLLRGLVPACL